MLDDCGADVQHIPSRERYHRNGTEMSRGPFDRELVAARLRRAMRNGPQAHVDFLYRLALEEVAARLSAVNRTFRDAMICTAAPCDAAEYLMDTGRVERIIRTAPPGVPEEAGAERILDPEHPDLPREELDLFISVFDLAFVNDLPGALAAIRRALRPDGLFLAVLPGGETFHELRAAWALTDSQLDGEPSLRVAPFCTLEQLGSLLQLAGFALPVTDSERLIIRYTDALSLMQEIRAMGWSNPLQNRPRKPVTRQHLALAAAQMETAFSNPDGRIRCTVEFCHLSGWAPHESQQKPARPGSADIHLGEALSACRTTIASDKETDC